MGPDLAADAVLARAALLETQPPTGWRAELHRGASAHFPVKAADLPGLSGAALGAQLKALEQRWCDSDLTLTRAELLG